MRIGAVLVAVKLDIEVDAAVLQPLDSITAVGASYDAEQDLVLLVIAPRLETLRLTDPAAIVRSLEIVATVSAAETVVADTLTVAGGEAAAHEGERLRSLN